MIGMLLKNEWLKSTKNKVLLIFMVIPTFYPWYFVITQIQKLNHQTGDNYHDGISSFKNAFLNYQLEVNFIYLMVLLPIFSILLASSYGESSFRTKELQIFKTYPITSRDILISKFLFLCFLGVSSGLLFFISTQVAFLFLVSIKPIIKEYMLQLSWSEVIYRAFINQLWFIWLNIPLLLLSYCISLKFKNGIILNVLLFLFLMIPGLMVNKASILFYPTFPFKYFTKILVETKGNHLPLSTNLLTNSPILFLHSTVLIVIFVIFTYKKIIKHEN